MNNRRQHNLSFAWFGFYFSRALRALC